MGASEEENENEDELNTFLSTFWKDINFVKIIFEKMYDSPSKIVEFESYNVRAKMDFIKIDPSDEGAKQAISTLKELLPDAKFDVQPVLPQGNIKMPYWPVKKTKATFQLQRDITYHVTNV